MRTLKFQNQRREKIFNLLLTKRSMTVSDLSRQLRVTGATIRSDLEALTQQQKIIRTYGGAVVPRESAAAEIPIQLRLGDQAAEKLAIGKVAASLVKDGMVCGLDASTTSLAVAHYLRERKALTIVTNSIPVASLFIEAPGVNVIVPGGTMRHESSSLVGPEAVAFLSKRELDYCFMGAHSVHSQRGLGEVNQAETEIKLALAGISRRVIALTDSTKWNRVSITYFWPLEKVDTLITDGRVSREIREFLKAKGVKVILAS